MTNTNQRLARLAELYDDRDLLRLAKLLYRKAVWDGHITEPNFERLKQRIWSEYEQNNISR